MSDEELTVGQIVARARVAAGLTVDQVAAATRIRGTLVRAIENDDFSLCGGDVYARGHLKSIATAVGLAPADLVAAFDAERGAPKPVAVESQVQPVQAPQRAGAVSLGALAAPLGGNVEGRRGGGGTNWTAVMALALAVIVGVGVISALNNRSSSTVAGPTPTASSTPSTPSAEPTPSQSPEPQPTPSPTDAVAEADGVTVVLDVTGKAAWVRITGGASAETLYEGTLSKGDSQTFTDDDQINLVIGDAGAVNLTVNGRELGEPGSSGQVVRLEFGPGDPTGSAG